jgi:hypothetical protein
MSVGPDQLSYLEEPPQQPLSTFQLTLLPPQRPQYREVSFFLFLRFLSLSHSSLVATAVMRIRYDLIEANDRAVQLLHHASYSRAIHTLENALQFLRVVAVETSTALNSDVDRNRRAPASDASTSSKSSSSRTDRVLPQDEEIQDHGHRHVGDLHIRASPHKCNLWSARSPDGFFSFCSRPMILMGTQEQVVLSSHNQNRAAAALMYNLSLAYQGAYGSGSQPNPSPNSSRSSYQPPPSSPPTSSSSFAALGDRILMCSLKICTMAVDLMSRLPAPVITPGDSVLYVSCLNNQGFLHVHFSNRADANRSMTMLECFFASHAPDDIDVNLEYCEMEGTTDNQGRTGTQPPLSDREAYKCAVNDVVYSVLLCQGRTVLDAAPAA